MGVPDDELYGCEELGTCDDSCSPPARGDCLIEFEVESVTPAPPPGELPATGLDSVVLLLISLMVIVCGLGVIYGRRGE